MHALRCRFACPVAPAHAGSLPLQQLLRYGGQILSALVELHGQGVIMADLKPQNLLLDEDLDELVVTDFGLSRIVSHTGAHELGTPLDVPANSKHLSFSFGKHQLLLLQSVLVLLTALIPPSRTHRYAAVRLILTAF